MSQDLHHLLTSVQSDRSRRQTMQDGESLKRMEDTTSLDSVSKSILDLFKEPVQTSLPLLRLFLILQILRRCQISCLRTYDRVSLVTFRWQGRSNKSSGPIIDPAQFIQKPFQNAFLNGIPSESRGKKFPKERLLIDQSHSLIKCSYRLGFLGALFSNPRFLW